MKTRTAFISAILSLLPFGQPLLIKTGAVLSPTGFMISLPEKVKAESAYSFYQSGKNNYSTGDYFKAVYDFTRAIEIDPNYKSAYKNRGIAKEMIGDLKGACDDWRKTVDLSPNDSAAKWLRDQC